MKNRKSTRFDIEDKALAVKDMVETGAVDLHLEKYVATKLATMAAVTVLMSHCHASRGSKSHVVIKTGIKTKRLAGQ